MVPASSDAEIVRVPFKTEFLESLTIDQLDSLLENEKKYNKTVVHGEPLSHYFSSLSTEELSYVASTIRHCLSKETDVLSRFSEIGLDPFVEDLREVEFPFEVHYISEAQMQAMALAGVSSRACYTGGKIYFGGELPDLRERTFQIAGKGIFGNDLFHEVFHGFQDDGGHKVFWSVEDVIAAVMYPESDEPKVALAEAHAWLCTLRGFKDDVLIQTIRHSYHFQTSRYLDSAFGTIRELASLGLSDAEVGGLVGRAQWDEETGGYALLEETRDEILIERNKSRERLATKVSKHKLIDRILAVRAVGIAREICQEKMHNNVKASFPAFSTLT